MSLHKNKNKNEKNDALSNDETVRLLRLIDENALTIRRFIEERKKGVRHRESTVRKIVRHTRQVLARVWSYARIAGHGSRVTQFLLVATLFDQSGSKFLGWMCAVSALVDVVMHMSESLATLALLGMFVGIAGNIPVAVRRSRSAASTVSFVVTTAARAKAFLRVFSRS